MAQKEHLECDDFPVASEKNKVITDKGATVAITPSPAAAHDIADRLNEQAAREEEDRWSA